MQINDSVVVVGKRRPRKKNEGSVVGRTDVTPRATPENPFIDFWAFNSSGGAMNLQIFVRFDKVIYVPNTDREGRKSIIDAQCCSLEKNGAACRGACREAAMLAIRESLENGGQSMPVVLYHHLEVSLIAVKPLLSNASVLSEYTSFEEEYSK